MIKQDSVEMVICDGLAIANVVLHNLLGRAVVAAGSQRLPFQAAWKLCKDSRLG